MAKIEQLPAHTGPRFKYDLGSRFLPLGWAGKPALSADGTTILSRGVHLNPEILIETPEEMDTGKWFPFSVGLMHDILKKAVSIEIPMALRITAGSKQLRVGVSEPGYLVPVTAFVLHRKHAGLRFSFVDNANPFDGLWKGEILVNEYTDPVPPHWTERPLLRWMQRFTGRPERTRAVEKIGYIIRENPVETRGFRFTSTEGASAVSGQATQV
ncbi:hypothetical protein HZB58_03655 [Candidatus Gottesmanbacteria bacterium]|nr:hypothetical protein [Candidatus Gottesmanbacteria bacterium]